LELTVRKRYIDILDPVQFKFWENTVRKGNIITHSAHIYLDSSQYDVSDVDENKRISTVKKIVQKMGYLSKINVQYVVIHISDDKKIRDSERDKRLFQAKKSLMELATHCKVTGVKLASEILPYPYIPKDTIELQKIITDCDPEYIGICIDTNNVNLSEDLSLTIEKLSSRIYGFHFSDNDGKEERHWYPLEGVIDWAKVMRSIRKIGYSGPINFEFGEPASDSLEEDIKKRIEIFNKLISMV